MSWVIAISIIVVILLILIIFTVWGTCTESGKSAFSNIKARLTGSSNSQLKDLDVIMFIRSDCDFCKKTLSMLESEGSINDIQIIDINKPEGLEMAKNYGADRTGQVPAFVSRKLKTGVVGAKTSVKELLDSLTIKPGDVPSSSEQSTDIMGITRSLGIVLFTSETCGFCKRAKDMCDEMGVTDFITIVDLNTPNGMAMAEQLVPPGTTGVPIWVSQATKKHVMGFRPFNEVIEQLK